MNKRIFLLILTTLCLIFVLCSCSCDNENHDHNHITSSSKGDIILDNQNPEPPPLVNKPCDHYWCKVEIDKNTDSTSSVYLKGECYLCGDYLNDEVVTIVSYEEWKNALSHIGLNSFTTYIGDTYTDYTENSTRVWKVENSIFTEEFFINSQNNANSYVTESFSGYALMYNSFVYNKDTRTYIYTIDETSYIELGFADGKLNYHATVSVVDHNEQKSVTLYLNHGKINIELPDYFNEIYGSATSKEVIDKTTLTPSMANDVYGFISSLKFEGSYEVSFLANSKLSVHFYTKGDSDPIFNEAYESVTVVIDNDKLEALKIGNNTIEFDYK